MTSATELDALFCRSTLPDTEISRRVQELVDKQQQYQGDERRASMRYPMAFPVVAVPIEEDEKTGEAFAAITRDISTQGLSIYHTRAVLEPYLAIQWTADDGEQVRALVEVVRCRPVGPFFYEVAGIFVTKSAA